MMVAAVQATTSPGPAYYRARANEDIEGLPGGVSHGVGHTVYFTDVSGGSLEKALCISQHILHTHSISTAMRCVL